VDGLPVTVTLYPCKAASQVPLLNVPPVPFQRIKDAFVTDTLNVCVLLGATGLVYVIAPQVGTGAAGVVTVTPALPTLSVSLLSSTTLPLSTLT